jgi:hypothetical protein
MGSSLASVTITITTYPAADEQTSGQRSAGQGIMELVERRKLAGKANIAARNLAIISIFMFMAPEG